MGKQSARLYFQGKDHKEIYYQGHYHKAMYIGSQLVWEKITGAKKELDRVSSISYNGVFYVVRQFKYSDSDAELRILVGTALDELVLFDTIKNLERASDYIILTKDMFSIIFWGRTGGPTKWYSYLATEKGLDFNTYKENDMPVYAEVQGYSSYIILHDQVFFSNYIGGNSEFKNLPGFNNNSVYDSDSGDVFRDVFLVDGLIWGISCKLHSDSKMTYIKQYCYSTDENLNMGKKIITFPSDVVEDIRLHLIAQLRNKYDYEEIKIENIVFIDAKYGASSPDITYGVSYPNTEYTVNGMCYRYVDIAPDVTFNYEGSSSINRDTKISVLLVYCISLSEFKIADAYIVDRGYESGLYGYDYLWYDNKWNIPYEIKYWQDFGEFVLYQTINKSSGNVEFIYNIKAEGDATHIVTHPTVSGISKYNLDNGAYMIDNYIYINHWIYASGDMATQLRIDTVNNTIEEIQRPTISYMEEK